MRVAREGEQTEAIVNARVQRNLWLARDGGPVVRDALVALGPNPDAVTHLLGGTHLAWAFVEGWVRLSDGQRVA